MSLFVGVLGGLSMMALTAVSASLSDLLGRRRIILFGFALALPWSFAVMPLLDSGSRVLFAVAIAGTLATIRVFFGPLASFIPEIFPTRYRYTGAGLAFNIGGVIGGAVPPVIAGALVATWGGLAIGLMMAIFVLTSLACTFLLPETMGTTLTDTDNG